MDENLGRSHADFLRRTGHDVMTVPEQNMCAASDRNLLSVSSRESRCLVTLDLDFANPLVFPPSEHAGVVVLRLPSKSAPSDLHMLLQTLTAGLAQNSVVGKLWIIEPGRIRVYNPGDDEKNQ